MNKTVCAAFLRSTPLLERVAYPVPSQPGADHLGSRGRRLLCAGEEMDLELGSAGRSAAFGWNAP
jgi:hypothetical protein